MKILKFFKNLNPCDKAEFVRQMLRLRARHQNRLPHELIEQAGPVETHMAKQPKMYDERWCNISNTPLIQVRGNG